MYGHKSDNLDEIDQFLERQNIPKFIQGKTDNLNSLMFLIQIKSIINKLLKQHQAQIFFTGEFYQTFKSKLIPNSLQNLPKKMEEEETNSFQEDSIILIPNPGKDATRKENNRPVFLMNIDEKSSTKY